MSLLRHLRLHADESIGQPLVRETFIILSLTRTTSDIAAPTVLEHVERDFAPMFAAFRTTPWDPCEHNRVPMNQEAARSFRSCILNALSKCALT